MNQNRGAIVKVVGAILKGVGRTYNGKVEVPLLALLKFFVSLTCHRKKWSNVHNTTSTSMKVNGKIKGSLAIVEDSAESLLSTPGNSDDEDPNGEVKDSLRNCTTCGRRSDHGRFMLCQLQPFT